MRAEIQQVGKSSFAVIGAEGATNFGIVRSEGGSAVLIDADIRRIDEVEEALKRAGCARTQYLLNTHEHFDHTSGNHYFEQQGATVVSSEGCWQALKDEGDREFARMTTPVPELFTRFPGIRMGLPHLTFSETATLCLPGATLRLSYQAHNGHSHSKGDAIAFLEEEEILFTGDLLYTQVHPVIFFGIIPAWLASLNSLMQLSFRLLVPGHGPIVKGEKEGKEAFKKLYHYLEDFYQQLQEAKAGRKTAEEVATHMASGAYASLGKTRMIKRNIDHFLKGSWR